jgi:hypothetical protein
MSTVGASIEPGRGLCWHPGGPGHGIVLDGRVGIRARQARGGTAADGNGSVCVSEMTTRAEALLRHAGIRGAWSCPAS